MTKEIQSQLEKNRAVFYAISERERGAAEAPPRPLRFSDGFAQERIARPVQEVTEQDRARIVEDAQTVTGTDAGREMRVYTLDQPVDVRTVIAAAPDIAVQEIGQVENPPAAGETDRTLDALFDRLQAEARLNPQPFYEAYDQGGY